MKEFREVLNEIQHLIEQGQGANEGDLKGLWNDLSDAITEGEFPKITKFRNKTSFDKSNEIPTEGRSILQLLSNHSIEILEVAQSAKNMFRIGDEVRLKVSSRMRKINYFTIQDNGIFYAHFDGNFLTRGIAAAKLEDLF